MIDLYTWTTPNGRKISIMLEETGLPYTVKPIDTSKGEQFEEAFLAISPNNKIPAILDHEAEGGPLAVFESGAILVYLGDKSGQFLAPSGPQRYRALEWTFWQVGGLGPMLGQLGFFALRSKERSPEAIERFTTEAVRLFTVMDRRLAEHPYLAGADYSIADIAAYPWAAAAAPLVRQTAAEAFGEKPALTAWLERIAARPAVARGMAIPKV